MINHNPEISIVPGQSPQCRQDSPSVSPPPILLDEGRDILLNVVLLQSLALPPTSGGVMSQFRAAFFAGSNTQPHSSILLEAFQGNTFLGRIQSLSSNGYGSEFNNKETAGASPFRSPGQAYVHSQMVVERLFFCLSFFWGGPFHARRRTDTRNIPPNLLHAWVAQSMASCCMSSAMSAFLITAWWGWLHYFTMIQVSP